jgi:hypothetical protein
MKSKTTLNSFIVFFLLLLFISFTLGMLLGSEAAAFIYLAIISSAALISACIYSSSKS